MGRSNGLPHSERSITMHILPVDRRFTTPQCGPIVALDITGSGWFWSPPEIRKQV
jgi:hypothetical protein